MRARNSTSSSSSSNSSGKANSSSAAAGSSSSSSSTSKKKLTPAQHYAKDLSMASALSSVWTYNRDLCGNLTGPAVPDDSAVQSTASTATSGISSSSSASASGRAAAARAAAAAAGTIVPTKASATITAAAAAEQVYTGSKLLCQCSSLASLSAEWLNTFYDNFTVKAGTSSGATASTSKSTDALDMQIVWPTAASIRNSLSGWQAGDSIFCQPSNMFEVRTACYTHAS
jgi:trimeric autotransporter adhesin